MRLPDFFDKAAQATPQAAAVMLTPSAVLAAPEPSAWALMLTGRVIRMDQQGEDLAGVMRRLVARSGEPVIRQAVTQAMRILGRQFVMGRTIEEALDRLAPEPRRLVHLRLQGYEVGEMARLTGRSNRTRCTMGWPCVLV